MQRDRADKTGERNPRLRQISGLDRRNSRGWVRYEGNISKAGWQSLKSNRIVGAGNSFEAGRTAVSVTRTFVRSSAYSRKPTCARKFADYEKDNPRKNHIVPRRPQKFDKPRVFAAPLASHPATPRLLCGSVYLGTHSRVSPRRGAVQWHCLGVQFVSVLYGLLRSYHSGVQFRRRESIGSLHWHRGILPATLRTRPGSL